ncbi:sporulation protein [Nonomuraea rubra]
MVELVNGDMSALAALYDKIGERALCRGSESAPPAGVLSWWCAAWRSTKVIAFQAAIPWRTPISEIGGRQLPGMALGVRTEVTIAAIVGRSDLDLVAVKPAPS